MPPGPIVHIGYHKTATTWFQQSFYPRVGNAHFVPRNVVRRAFLDPTALKFDPVRARALLPAGKAMPLLLCEEGLSGYPHNGGLAGYLSREMACRIRDALPDARIVIFIRSQPAMIAAAYQQYVKGGGTYSIRRYLFPEQYLRGASAEMAKAPRFQFDHFEYDALIRHYRAVFGEDRVHIRLFEDFRKSPADFLRAYCADLGLDVDLGQVDMAAKYRSYNRPALWLSRFLGLFTYRTVIDKHWLLHVPFCYPAMRGLCEALNALPFVRAPGPRALLGRRLCRWIEARFAESNRRLLHETGLALHEHGYPLASGEMPLRPPGSIFPSWIWT